MLEGWVTNLKTINKVTKTSTILAKCFFVYFLLSVIIYIVSFSVFNILYRNYSLSDVQSYFAEPEDSGAYPSIDKELIMAAGGWTATLDEQGDVIGTMGLENVTGFNLVDITDLTNGKCKINGIEFFATPASYT